MFIKPLAPPIYTLQMEALSNRLSPTHHLKEEITLKAKNLRAGFVGESSLEYEFGFLPPEKYLIFSNLRIPDAHNYFQIDFLLLSAHFILIIEVKNVRGQVVFSDMGQALRIDNELEQVFKNPIDQIKMQHSRLQSWLQQFNLPALPIEKVVVYTNQNTILKNITNDQETRELVIPKDKLLEKIKRFSTKHGAVRLTEAERFELSFQLLDAHVEDDKSLLDKYELNYHGLIKGVICPECKIALMSYLRGNWRCLSCGKMTKTAHLAALADYALLVNKYIGNRQARDFLQIPSEYIVKKLLQNECKKYFGTNSGRKYELDLEVLL